MELDWFVPKTGLHSLQEGLKNQSWDAEKGGGKKRRYHRHNQPRSADAGCVWEVRSDGRLPLCCLLGRLYHLLFCCSAAACLKKQPSFFRVFKFFFLLSIKQPSQTNSSRTIVAHPQAPSVGRSRKEGGSTGRGRREAWWWWFMVALGAGGRRGGDVGNEIVVVVVMPVRPVIYMNLVYICIVFSVRTYHTCINSMYQVYNRYICIRL